MRRKIRPLLTLLVIAGAACTSAAVPAAPSPEAGPVVSSPDTAAPAPWVTVPVPESAVAPVYVAEWRKAENRSHCRLLAPERAGAGISAGATARAATFGGGWGVAYDRPGLRSAFGVAGTGASAWSGDVYDAWPERRQYADGSRVGYGPEGGTGPNWLAYIRIPGQECLYNVWSRIGRAHLESLLASLRFVTVDAPLEAAWYRGGRPLDLTGDGRADSVHLEATGRRVDSLRITLTLIVDGSAKLRESWGSSYELAMADSVTRGGPRLDAYLRARLDSVLASVRLERLDAPGVRVMEEDRAILARLEPRPTHRVSFAYGYETVTRVVWDAPRRRFVGLWSCC